MNKEEIIRQAKKELLAEEFDEQVQKMKAKLRKQRQRKHLFPWRICIINLNEDTNGSS